MPATGAWMVEVDPALVESIWAVTLVGPPIEDWDTESAAADDFPAAASWVAEQAAAKKTISGIERIVTWGI